MKKKDIIKYSQEFINQQIAASGYDEQRSILKAYLHQLDRHFTAKPLSAEKEIPQHILTPAELDNTTAYLLQVVLNLRSKALDYFKALPAEQQENLIFEYNNTDNSYSYLQENMNQRVFNVASQLIQQANTTDSSCIEKQPF